MDDKLAARLNGLKLPNHIGMILDGNGRWAKARGRERMEGHVAGAKALERLVEIARDIGIHYVTVFAFSTENWNRPKKEVDGLMNLLAKYLARQDYKERGVRFQWAGEDDGKLSASNVARIRKIMAETAEEKDLIFTVCLNYGGRQEIVAAVKRAHAAGAIDGLTVENFGRFMHADRPDVDLLLRTSGEKRVSNFTLWHLAYAELYFPDYHWPDFDEEKMVEAIEEFNRRNRRFGAIKEES